MQRPAPVHGGEVVAVRCRARRPVADALSVLGLSLLINDDDGAGRKQGLTLGPAGSEPIGRRWLWKRCQLAP